MLKLTWPRAVAWRMRRHPLDQRAQVRPSAELALWARVEDLDRRAVLSAKVGESRSIRQTPLRPPRAGTSQDTVRLLPGRMEGVWRHEIKGSRVDMVIKPHPESLNS